jgi:hypothetical protein
MISYVGAKLLPPWAQTFFASIGANILPPWVQTFCLCRHSKQLAYVGATGGQHFCHINKVTAYGSLCCSTAFA